MKLNPIRQPTDRWEFSTSQWSLYDGDRKVAVLYMDVWDQIDQVVLCPETSSQDQIQALSLAASHVMRYAVRRLNGILIDKSYATPASWRRSFGILNDGIVPDGLVGMDVEMLTLALRDTEVGVTFAHVATLEGAIETALGDERLQAFPVTYNLGDPTNSNYLQYVAFTVDLPARFRVWRHLYKPGSHTRDIIPAYHPVMSDKSSVGRISSRTNQLGWDKVVRYIMAPPASRADGVDGPRTSFWEHLNHPYYAAGPDIVVQISQIRALSLAGIDEIRSLLLALLELENTYLEVDISLTDFAGYDKKKFHSWAYRVLEEEGSLDDAYVPPGFSPEG